MRLQNEDIRKDKGYLLISKFILGLTTILWAWKFFLNPADIVTSPRLGIKKSESFLVGGKLKVSGYVK